MSRSARLADGAFLASLVVLSAALYVAGLGFVSDDWNFLGDLVTAPDQSLGGLLRRQWDHGVMLRVRPPQLLYQAVLYKAFGLEPLGYHLVNVAALCALAVLLHWVLLELRAARLLAVAVPAVYLLLPHYTTNRFWFASAGYGLTIAFALLSMGADIRAARSAAPRARLAWRLLALVALAVAALGYENVFPLLAAAPFVAWWATRSPEDGRGRSARGLLRRVAPHVIVLAAAAAYKVAVGGENLLNASYVRHLGRLAMVVVGPNLGTYGVGLPAAAAWAARHATWPVLVASVALAAWVFAYLAALGRAGDAGRPRAAAGWGRMALAGLATLALGYAAFLMTNGHVFFTSTGFGNRTAMAAALGVAVLFVAAIGWLSERLAVRGVPERAAFAGLTALVCQAGFLVTNALALDHVAARRAQEAALRDIRALVPAPAPGSAVILRGVCPYVGSAIVFERDDLEGALRATYRLDALEGDVGSILVAGERGLQTAATGYSPVTYPYGPGLLLVDLERRTSTPVPSRERAIEQIGARRLGWPDRCPAGAPELSVPIFNLDRLAVPFFYKRFP